MVSGSVETRRQHIGSEGIVGLPAASIQTLYDWIGARTLTL